MRPGLARALALAALGLLAGCTDIPRGGDPGSKLAPLRSEARPRFGPVAVAAIATCSLAPSEEAKGWRASEAIDADEVRRDLAKGIESAGTFERVRLAGPGGAGEAWAEQDDLVVSVALAGIKTEFVGHNGWWIPNMINFALWVWPAWLVATERYALELEARVQVSSGNSGATLLERRVPVRVEGTFDEWDRGWQLLGPIRPSNEAENWRRIASLLLPAARLAASEAVARDLDQGLRAVAATPEFREAQRKTLVLAVGVGRYLDPNRLPPLAWAAEDAAAVAQAVRARGEAPEHALVLADADATLAAVGSAIAAHLGRAREGDTVLVYFAAYGTRGADGSPALLLHDSAPDARTLPLEALARALADVRGDKLLVLDASFDGRGRSLAGGAAAPGSDDARALEAVPSLATVLAAGPGEPALGAEHEGHGLLTAHLLAALAPDDKGTRTARDVFASVRPRVVHDAAILGERQNPRALGLERPWALAEPAGRRTREGEGAPR